MDTAKVSSSTPAQIDSNQLYEEYFEKYLVLHPDLAQAIGDDRYNHSFADDLSDEHRAASKELAEEYLRRAIELDLRAASRRERLTRDLFVYLRKQELRAMATPEHLLPINQFDSAPAYFAQLGSGQGAHPFESEKDYRDFIRKADGFSVWVDTAIKRMREGTKVGIVLPQVLIKKTLPQLQAHFGQPALEDNLFAGPLKNLPEELQGEDGAELVADYEACIRNTIMPAYQRLHEYMANEYMRAGRATHGLGALPGGREWYQERIRFHTTTEMTPEEIHELGHKEVARIIEEMNQVRKDVKFPEGLDEFFTHLSTNDKFFFAKEDDLIAGYAQIKSKIDGLLPKYFSVFPKAAYEVRPVEAFRAESAAGASYQAGTPDGERAGIFYINTHNLRAQPKWGMETLSLHEAAPGHHFQISIQQEMEGVPRFQRFTDSTAFAEGWALYAESIGKEMGLFSDPYQYFGRLSDELLRAMRLVVDTGLHAKGWTREQAIHYMLKNSAMAESDVVAEVERYMAIPGQALSYKVGQLSITKLRAEAEQSMGPAFDIREFHSQVLLDGSLPMELLAEKIHSWQTSSPKSSTP